MTASPVAAATVQFNPETRLFIDGRLRDSSTGTTDWSTNHDFRQRCLMQLHDALQEEKEEIRAELIAEVGATVGMTYIAQLEWPLADAIRYPAALISTFQWERMLDQDA